MKSFFPQPVPERVFIFSQSFLRYHYTGTSCRKALSECLSLFHFPYFSFHSPALKKHEKTIPSSPTGWHTIHSVFSSYRSSFGTLPFPAGCRAVTGLVPRALFIGIIQLHLYYSTEICFFLLCRFCRFRRQSAANCRLILIPIHTNPTL